MATDANRESSDCGAEAAWAKLCQTASDERLGEDRALDDDLDAPLLLFEGGLVCSQRG